MSSFSHADYLLMLQRLEGNKLRSPTASEPDTEREVGKGGLHEKIMQWCDSQWYCWKYIHHRTDKRSGIQEGAHDFTIFVPGGRLLCIECKMPGKKLSEAQLIWRKELEMLGHTVHVVTTFEEFTQLALAAAL